MTILLALLRFAFLGLLLGVILYTLGMMRRHLD
jgi:hypothetical protein